MNRHSEMIEGAKIEKATREEGQSLLEFALIVVLLITILFAMIDFARIFFAYATMSNGAREAARYGVVHPGDDTGIDDAARAMMLVFGGSDPAVTITYWGDNLDVDEPNYIDPSCTHSIQCQVQVRISSDMDVWTPIIPSLTIVATSTMTIE